MSQLTQEKHFSFSKDNNAENDILKNSERFATGTLLAFEASITEGSHEAVEMSHECVYIKKLQIEDNHEG